MLENFRAKVLKKNKGPRIPSCGIPHLSSLALDNMPCHVVYFRIPMGVGYPIVFNLETGTHILTQMTVAKDKTFSICG